MNLFPRLATITLLLTIYAPQTQTYALAQSISIRSFSKTSHFAPYEDLKHPQSMFILDTVAESKPYLWIGSDESLLRSIQDDNLIVCFENKEPVGFLSYHTLVIPPYGIPYCEACDALKKSGTHTNKIFIGHIHVLAIQKKARGKGYGTLLVKKALEQITMIAKNKKMAPVIGIAVHPKNEPAIHLYTKKFGFENLNVLIHHGAHWVLKQPLIATNTRLSLLPTNNIYAILVLILLLGFIIYRAKTRRS